MITFNLLNEILENWEKKLHLGKGEIKETKSFFAYYCITGVLSIEEIKYLEDSLKNIKPKIYIEASNNKFIIWINK